MIDTILTQGMKKNLQTLANHLKKGKAGYPIQLEKYERSKIYFNFYDELSSEIFTLCLVLILVSYLDL